ncbi:MAG: hypothetical protein JXA78_04090 [Anaerolineales bacterium]|nr:hypothetical protein [Anaerolineales bacterium]
MRDARFRLFISTILILVPLVSLSCLAGSSPKQPTPTLIPASTEALEQLGEEVQSAVETAQSGGPIQMTITEQQLTSLAVMGVQSGPDVNIKNLQVHLQNGQIQITGQAESKGFNLPVSITLEISVDANGQPHSNVITAKVGPFSIPDSMLEQITTQLDQALMNRLVAENMVIDSIHIADGAMTITGHAP